LLSEAACVTISCGFDFGTSNTTIGVTAENTCRLIPLERGKSTIRSAIFCDNEMNQWVFGQEGVDRYLDSVPGRLMMSLKSVLGSSLMDDKTVIFNEYISYTEVLRQFMQHIKLKAEAEINAELTRVVLGRPVHFHDHDPLKDKLAQDTLEKIARTVGFKEISFQYEPIAAAIAYETSIQKEQIALIIDMGGGTSDFTVIHLSPGKKSADRSKDVLANCGIHIAGTDFDQRLSLETVMPLLGMRSFIRGSSSDIEIPAMLYHDLTTWHTLTNQYTPAHIAHVRSIQARAHEPELLERLINVLKRRAAHYILNSVEMTKQNLSDSLQTNMDLGFIENELNVTVLRTLLNTVIEDYIQQITTTVEHTVQTAGVKFSDINAIFYTGGSTKVPVIREKISALCPNAEVVVGDAFGSVGIGLTIDAQRKYLE
jgi:hypothetical chaperone protein